MSFPVLSAHQIGRSFFNLSGRLYPIGIRDQMVRGQLLIDQAIAKGLIARDRPLLVVGAGAAGATVAMHAASYQSPTTLVERETNFNLQTGCSSRWVDPAQYDWPTEHWDTEQYPFCDDADEVPLAWEANWGSRLALAWQAQLRQAERHHPLKVIYGATAIKPAPTNKPLDGKWVMEFVNEESRASWTKPFAMVVWTVGFGQETHWIKATGDMTANFYGPGFWEKDFFADSHYGLPEDVTTRIVISGAGDGGLQDFLRIVTVHKSARDIMKALDLPEPLVRRLQTAENHAQRDYLWSNSNSRQHDHAILQPLHKKHLELAHTLSRALHIQEHLERLLRRKLPETLHLVHSCDHFPNTYGLNRFLVLLIATYLEQERGQSDIIIPRKRTHQVTSAAGHTCDGQPYSESRCYGQPHCVELINAISCWDKTASISSKTQEIKANIVIVRHGMRLPDNPLPEAPSPRQALPYYVYKLPESASHP